MTVSAVFQADFETLKREAETDLNSKLESKTKGLEKIVIENERLRKEIKRVTSFMTCYKLVLKKLSRGRINYSKKKNLSKKSKCLFLSLGYACHCKRKWRLQKG